MTRTLEVLFTPADFGRLPQRDLSRSTCVVFDVLRATTTMITALANGARAIIPVAELPEALELRRQRPAVLLAGERNGVRIRAAQTGSIDFDLGNSPREFTPERLRGKTVVMSTTNGTRALRACAAARTVLIGSLLNLKVTAAWLAERPPANLLVICAGTYEQAAYEDALAAGALCDALWRRYRDGAIADSALMARRLYREVRGDLLQALQTSRNGRRLLRIPELAADVPACARRNALEVVARMSANGTIKRIAPRSARLSNHD